ncbi:MAG TPA: 2-oxo acid dehydrogenase subunit E2 [Ignavibacteriales bacterium]|nr:2-oxo acid dehydrogenase subunit E2 [Ignavibacteriales bacterium]HOL80641.1 2-oxo acid dehydrogenase subunit E2 [Ignavibacteriales bacterium]HOM64329.1 2-oxo acid dehydrogenase subunit E2 [Ignavibacteriales bacterium]HPP33025.1 2-oxo acid dehydrogenase subunit E2 [Ignavibacteriales bacterium]HRR18333.1 2-oxo acid dehydrogenase subunit E2 [Ignavibacteriales bacterium]
MSSIFKLPTLGENIQNATVVKLNVKVGDFVKVEQLLAEVEAGKANLEITSDFEGQIVKIYANEGDTINPGDDFIEYDNANASNKQEQSQSEKNVEVKVTQNKIENNAENTTKIHKVTENEIIVTVPNLGENVKDATIIKIAIEIGAQVKKNDLLFEVETGKATLEIVSEYDGLVKNIFVKEGDKVNNNDKLLSLVSEEVPVNQAIKSDSKVNDNTIPTSIQNENLNKEISTQSENKTQDTPKEKVDTYNINKNLLVLASPSVRKFAREIGVDISEVKPQQGKRITIEDVKYHAKKLLSGGKSISQEIKYNAGNTYFEPLPDFTKWGEINVDELSNIRKVTAQHLHFAWSQIPHVTQFDKADITELENFRKNILKKYPEAKITVTAILVKIVTLALKKYKQFNSSLDLDNNKIIYKQYYNIGIAVDTTKGLVVPVLRNTDKKTLIEISQEINVLAQKARENKLSLDEMQGATFTISNLGGIGGTYFTPIVNYPEVAILGVSKSSYEPRYNGETFEPKLMLPLSLSYDHRVIDGADGIRFLRYIIDIVEKPYELLMTI